MPRCILVFGLLLCKISFEKDQLLNISGFEFTITGKKKRNCWMLTCLVFLFVLSRKIDVVLCFLLLEGSVSSCLLRCQSKNPHSDLKNVCSKTSGQKLWLPQAFSPGALLALPGEVLKINWQWTSVTYDVPHSVHPLLLLSVPPVLSKWASPISCSPAIFPHSALWK